MTKTLLEQIEEDALDSRRSMADALRKCIALGGRSNSDALRAWANQELQGYNKPEDVPGYRIIAAPIVIDGVAGYNVITAQPFSSFDLPQEIRDQGISESLRMTHGIGELEEMARRATEKDEPIRLGLPRGDLVAKWLTHKFGEPDFTSVQRIYWSASPTSVFGVVDQVRTMLVEFVAEIRSETGSAQDPPREAVQNAVNLVFHDKASRVTVNTAQATGSGPATVAPTPIDQSPPWWRTTKALWSLAVGLATIAAAVLAYLALN